MHPKLIALFLNSALTVPFSQAQTNGASGGDISLSITPAQLKQNFPGGTKSNIPGAPTLPSTTIQISQYPTQDRIPPTDSAVVKEWISKIDMSKVPAIKPNGLNGCTNTTFNAEAIAKSGQSDNCWWTCGGCTRSTDVTTCPTKGTWGATFDDGPSEYTPNLLQYLDEHQLKATFFIVGSRAISSPDILRAQYMLDHQMCLHTWSHPALTTITNEQIVAEVAWSMKAFKDILGVVPRCFRPPYADVDDRVRYILKAMGLEIIMWTGSGVTSFDTVDWRVVDGSTTVSASVQKFQQILSTASSLPTGFIVLAHDLFPQTVALSLRSFLPTALGNSNYKVQPINTCLGRTLASSYFETSSTATNGTNGTNTTKTTISISQNSPNGTSTNNPSTTTNPSHDKAASGASRSKCKIAASVLLLPMFWALV